MAVHRALSPRAFKGFTGVEMNITTMAISNLYSCFGFAMSYIWFNSEGYFRGEYGLGIDVLF
jgi:hypothetical protein